MHNTTSSYFLSFEGIEGSGKSTQIQKLAEYLKSKDKNVIVLREPGGTEFGEGLREAILKSNKELHPMAEAHLFASARSQILFEKIQPALKEENNIIILDRFIDSSIAYQGFARNLGAETILDIHKNSPLDIRPFITFYLKIDLETSFQRQNTRGNEKDYFEKSNKDFYESLIEGYDFCAKEFSRIETINAHSSPEEVFQEIINIIDQKVLKNG